MSKSDGTSHDAYPRCASNGENTKTTCEMTHNGFPSASVVTNPARLNLSVCLCVSLKSLDIIQRPVLDDKRRIEYNYSVALFFVSHLIAAAFEGRK